MPSHQALFDQATPPHLSLLPLSADRCRQVKDGPCKVHVARLIACNAKSSDCSKFFLM